MERRAGATGRRAGRGGSGRRARRSPSVMVVLLQRMVVVLRLVVMQEHGDRRLPLRTARVVLAARRRGRPPAVVLPRAALVGHGSLPLLGHQAPGHGQPSSEVFQGRARLDHRGVDDAYRSRAYAADDGI